LQVMSVSCNFFYLIDWWTVLCGGAACNLILCGGYIPYREYSHVCCSWPHTSDLAHARCISAKKLHTGASQDKKSWAHQVLALSSYTTHENKQVLRL
jgi:hypothetical protein